MHKPQPGGRRSVLPNWSRALDGQHVWGSVDFWPGRYGFRKYRLVVYPPGISAAERRLLRLWRGWPLWGIGLWLICEVVFNRMVSPGPALAWSTTVYLLSGALMFALSSQLRGQVRSLQVVLIDGSNDSCSAGLHAQWEELASLLIDADERLDRGQASPVQHEAVWWQAYDRLGQSARV